MASSEGANEGAADGLPAMQQRFEQAYEAHYRALYAYFFGRTADAEVAQDLLQETFLRVWRHRQRLAEHTSEQQRAWMFAIARNLLTDYYRRRASRSAAEETFAQSAAVCAGVPQDVEVEEAEQLALLHRAITGLPEDLRVVLALGVLGELSSAEIGVALGRPAGTVRYQMAKARRYLAEALRLLEPKE